MAADYKNRNRRKKKKSRQVPGWLWFLAGIFVGLFLALLLKLATTTPDKPASKPDPIGATESSSKPAGKKPRFEFYNILPEMEVVVPDHDEPAAPVQAPVPPKPAADDNRQHYVLQLASSRDKEALENLRAQVILLGFPAQTQTVDIDGVRWYRLRIGPGANLAEMRSIRDRLKKQNIDGMILKVQN